MYQRVGDVAYKANLDNTFALAAHLDHPETAFRSVHVAGTNGKGSVSHMLASVLQESGYKVGLYTSPHLRDFRERIKINGAMISEAAVTHFIARHKPFFESHQLSFFEMTVGLAFHYFRKEKVDIAIVEVGMGGRLDSTNIISPEVSVITNIGLDHTQFLGNSLAAIAREKAGIIKSGIPVVVGETTEETIGVFREVAKWQNAPLYLCEEQPFPEYASDLKGNYQKPNLRTVVATLRLLQDKNWKISEASITAGLSRTVANTGLLGRWQQLGEQPTIICDTAHNREGLQWVMQQLREQTYKQLHIVLGVVHDKDLTAILPLFPKKAAYYFCRPDVPRGLEAEDLAAEARKVGLEGTVYESVTVAYQSALNVAEADDFIFIGGSTFTVAEVV